MTNEDVRSIVVDRTTTISQFLESLGPQLTSESPDERESALSRLVSVLEQLPVDFLNEEQVGLLLNFLLARFETAALAGSDVISGLEYLITRACKVPANCEQPVFTALFKDGNVQGWPQKERAKMYRIMEWLFEKRLKELQALGSDVVLTFIHAIGGERDPRCLLQVFRLFIKVVASFSLGPFAEDLFEVVACYFPVEFKPLSGDATITRELLARACSLCLVANDAFAPYCYMLIEEKLTDEETSDELKLDVCRLLVEAVRKFPPAAVLAHTPTIHGGIRAVALNPKAKGDVAIEARDALCAVVSAVEKTEKKYVEQLVKSTIENLEPFVLQAEMGLTTRALSLLETTARVSRTGRQSVVDRVVAWIITLVQGDTVNAAANRFDVVTEALEALVHWLLLAEELGEVEVLHTFEDSLFASLDVARETAPAQALRANFECSAVYLRIKPSCSLSEHCSRLIVQSLNSAEIIQNRKSLLRLITQYATANRNDSLLQTVANESELYLCALVESIVDNDTWNAIRPLLEDAFTKCVFGAGAYEVIVEVIRRLSKDQQDTVVPFVHFVFDQFVQVSRLRRQEAVICARSIGLLITSDEHEQTCRRLIDIINDDVVFDTFACFLAQNVNRNILLPLLKRTLSDKTRHILLYSLANRAPSAVPKECITNDIDALYVTKGQLIAGMQPAFDVVTEIFSRFSNESSSLLASGALCTLFDFDSVDCDPVGLALNSTPLWKQRIFHHLVPLYVKSVSSCAEANREPLLQLLPVVLDFARSVQGAEDQLAQFLPIFIESFRSSSSVPSQTTLCALPTLLELVDADELSSATVSVLVPRLAASVSDESTLSGVLYSLTCLDTLGRRASLACQPLLAHVSGILTRALAHRKRVVRQKAANVKLTWELLTSK